jgi:hypothetical protein
MAVVSAVEVIAGTGLSGKYGETFVFSRKWKIRVDDPKTQKVLISRFVGVKFGDGHPEFADHKAMEFELSPEGKDGMRWILTVKYYVPDPKKKPKENGVPNDVWERQGGTTTYPVFVDASGTSITNSAGDPLEGLEREREETTWSFTKYYMHDDDLTTDVLAYDGKVNSATWATYGAKKWKCYFKGAKRVAIAQILFGNHLAAAQTPFHATGFDNDVALVHAFDGTDKNIVATGHEVVEQHLALGVADFLQNHLLGRHGADTANGHRFNRLFDVLIHLNIGDLLFGFKQQNFLVRQLQTSFVGDDVPAAESFVVARVAVQRHADIHVAFVQLLGGLGQGGLHGTQNHITLHVFLTGDRFDQH